MLFFSFFPRNKLFRTTATGWVSWSRSNCNQPKNSDQSLLNSEVVSECRVWPHQGSVAKITSSPSSCAEITERHVSCDYQTPACLSWLGNTSLCSSPRADSAFGSKFLAVSVTSRTKSWAVGVKFPGVPLVFQADRRIRLQADLQTLRHAVLCVLRGLLGERARNFRLNPGKIPGIPTARSRSHPQLCSELLFTLSSLLFAGVCGNVGQMLRECLWAWLNFPCRQGRKHSLIIIMFVLSSISTNLNLHNSQISFKILLSYFPTFWRWKINSKKKKKSCSHLYSPSRNCFPQQVLTSNFYIGLWKLTIHSITSQTNAYLIG